MIVKQNGEWLVKDSTGKKVLGKHKSKKSALSQLIAIEISKKKRHKVP